MHKQRAVRTPLIAAIAVLALFAVPAVAQAHHINTSATCELVNNVPTVKYKVDFLDFSTAAQSQVNGTVKVDGGTVQTIVNSGGLVWTNDDASISGSVPAAANTTHTVIADFTWGVGSDKQKRTTNTCPAPPAPPANPAIVLDKTGATTANAGATFTYSFKATNTGDVALTNVVLTDDKCQSTLTRTEPNLSDPTFDPGDSWYYSCTVVAPAGPATVDNTAKVCGDYVKPSKPTTTVCDEDTHTFTVPPPSTPPSTPPGDTPPGTTPPGTTPPAGSGEVLPEQVLSGRAVLRGPSGCARQAFTARVTGRSIASVTFSIDGRKVKTVGRGAFTLKVQPRKYGIGRHRIVALVKFTQRSGTANRRLPLTFRRCAQGAVAPRFTG